MVTDPYKVLGISKDATEDEIKKAYRKKAKECHPDLHPDDPHAQEKMNEVNEAYDMLKNPEKYRQQTFNGYSNSNPYGQSSFNGYQQYGQTYTYTNMNDFFNDFFYQQQRASTIPMPNFEDGDSEEIKNAISYIRGQNYQQAMSLLMNISSSYRNGRWYYLYALCCYGTGYRDRAYQAISKAVQMEPGRQDYQQVYNLLSQYQQNSFYNQGPFTYQRTMYRRPRHGIFYYFIMFQLLMWFLRVLFGGFAYVGPNNNYESNYYGDTPAQEYSRTNDVGKFN